MSDSELLLNEEEGSSCAAGMCQEDIMVDDSEEGGESTGKFGHSDSKDFNDPTSTFNRRLHFA